MKRIVTLLLAFCMLLAVGAYAAEEPAAYDTSDWDAVTLTVAIADNENDYSAQCFQWFAEQVSERSDGKISFQPYYGGTYCSLPEQYDNVASGAVDMTLWNQSINSDQFPIQAFIGLAAGNEEALDMTNFLVYENEETAPIFEKYATEGNIKMLGFIPAGLSLFCANKEVKTFSDFSDITFGTMLNAKLWASLGFNVVSTTPPEMYESLSRGVIDSACQALPSAVGKMFYEVTDYGLLSGYSAVAFNFIMNLDKWESLNEDQQALVQEVMAELEPYSIDLYNELEDGWLETWESETGNPVAIMSDEDAMTYIQNSYAMNYATFSGMAETIGAGEDFEVVADAVNDYLGIDCRAGA